MPNGMELLPWHAPASRPVSCSNLVVLSDLHRMETIATDFGILQSRQRISPSCGLRIGQWPLQSLI